MTRCRNRQNCNPRLAHIGWATDFWLARCGRLSLGTTTDLMLEFGLISYASMLNILGVLDFNGPNYPTNNSRVDMAFANAMKLSKDTFSAMGVGFANGDYSCSVFFTRSLLGASCVLSNAGNLIGVETTYCNSLESNATDFDSPQLILATVDSGSKYTTYNMVSGGNGGQSLVRGDPLSTGGYFDTLSRPWWQAGVAAGRRPGSQLGNSAISGIYSSKTVSESGSLMFSLVQPFFNSSNDLQGIFMWTECCRVTKYTAIAQWTSTSGAACPQRHQNCQ